MDIDNIVDKYLCENKQAWKKKIFKKWWGKSVEEIIKQARELSDKELSFLYDDGKDMGPKDSPRNIQMRTIEKEMEKRGLK